MDCILPPPFSSQRKASSSPWHSAQNIACDLQLHQSSWQHNPGIIWFLPMTFRTESQILFIYFFFGGQSKVSCGYILWRCNDWTEKWKACTKHFAQILIKINKAPISERQALFHKADFPSSPHFLPALKDAKTSKCHPVPITCYWVGMFANCMQWDPSIPAALPQIPRHRSQTGIACTFSSSFYWVQCGSSTFLSTGSSRHGN